MLIEHRRRLLDALQQCYRTTSRLLPVGRFGRPLAAILVPGFSGMGCNLKAENSERSRVPLRARTGVERESTDRLSCVGFGKWWCEAQEKGDRLPYWRCAM